MKLNITIISILISLCVIRFMTSAVHTGTITKVKLESFHQYVHEQNQLILDNLGSITQSSGNLEKQRLFYHQARTHYKQIEFFIEAVSPLEARYYINGPLVPKYAEEGYERVIYPHGFQKLEELLFSSDSLDNEELSAEIQLLSENIRKVDGYYAFLDVSEEQLLEMLQLQLYRMSSMGLNGYDATITQSNVKEIHWNLEGILRTLSHIHSQLENQPKEYSEIISKLKKAQGYSSRHTDFECFDRLKFITEYIQPINKLMILYHDQSGLPWGTNKQAINLQNPDDNYNEQFFSMYYNDTKLNKEQAELGRLLFYDPALSGNNKRSCSSCHNPFTGFSDGQEKSHSFDGSSKLTRNSPTLLNVIFQRSFFWDGRAYQLEQQVFDVVHNEKEMGSNLEEIALKLRKSDEYRELFGMAFNGTSDTTITAYAIQKAISEFEKTLNTFNSRFDDYLRGNKKALSERERNGYNVFAGKALCGSCHFFPLFNGSVPPQYTETEFEIIGTPSSKLNKDLDSDQGRISVTKVEEHRYAFKTPSIRNVELTGPYMHNGVYSSLEEVIDFYHKGGGRGFGYPVPNQTLPFDSLQINKKEKQDLILFMKSLTDTTFLQFYRNQSLKLPLFGSGSVLNDRKWGGEY